MRPIVYIALALLLISSCDQAVALPFFSKATRLLDRHGGIANFFSRYIRPPKDMKAAADFEDQVGREWEKWYRQGKPGSLQLPWLTSKEDARLTTLVRPFVEVLAEATNLANQAHSKTETINAWKVYQMDSVQRAFEWLGSPRFNKDLEDLQRKCERLEEAKVKSFRNKWLKSMKGRPNVVRVIKNRALVLARSELLRAKEERAAALKAKKDAALEAEREDALVAEREATFKAMKKAVLEAEREAALETTRNAALEAKREAALETKRNAALEAEWKAALAANWKAKLKPKWEAALEAERKAALERMPSVQEKKWRWPRFPWKWGQKRRDAPRTQERGLAGPQGE
ncbi:hypothetical protein ACQY0O_002408 [Thecaphora frezii]